MNHLKNISPKSEWINVPHDCSAITSWFYKLFCVTFLFYLLFSFFEVFINYSFTDLQELMGKKTCYQDSWSSSSDRILSRYGHKLKQQQLPANEHLLNSFCFLPSYLFRSKSSIIKGQEEVRDPICFDELATILCTNEEEFEILTAWLTWWMMEWI